MKKALSVMLCMIMLLALVPATVTAETNSIAILYANDTHCESDEKGGTFADTENHWAKDYVATATAKGLISGTSETEFSPDTNITRGMFIELLYRMAGRPAPQGTEPFTDVNDGDYYQSAVCWALENSIMKGESATAFNPEGDITREQMACAIFGLWVYKQADLPIVENPPVLKDLNTVSGWAFIEVQSCVQVGIFAGDEMGNFNPKNTTTRAEAVTVICRLLNMF